MIGNRLGQYEIEVSLGAGGMGEVYQAKDTRLGRSVAVKVLPEALAKDPERIARFEREAKVLASLNHANIAALHGFEQDGETHFLVMELVQGETLAERISRGPISAAEGLAIAHQILEALEAAHEKGIVHRDLKPANVKITPDGKVKVLDFGLAKAMDSSVANVNLSNSPTLSVMATNAGMILGTAAYMSPEQARGENTDTRSDVFSFGCVLYEMLAGRQAFQGRTVSDILASVLARELDFSLLPSKLNPEVPQLIRRAVEKEPKRRWQAVGDLRVEIEAAMTDPYGAGISAEEHRPFWKRAIPIIVTAVIVAAATAAGMWNLRTAKQAALTRFPFAIPEGQRFTRTGRHVLALSPDGANVVYVANQQLYLRPMAEMDSRPIQGTNLDVDTPFFSPDGHWIAFHSNAENKFKKIAVTGGASVTICDSPLPYGASWTPDGQVLIGAGAAGIQRVSENGGKPETIIAVKAGEFAHGPQLLPGGGAILFTLANGTGFDRWDRAQIVVQSLKSGERKTVREGGSDAHYVPSGHIVYMVGSNLMAVPFDLRSLTVTGGPVPVIEGVLRAASQATAAAFVAFSDNGSMVYVPGSSDAGLGRILALVDRNGARKPINVPPLPYFQPRISPNGKQLVVGTDDGKEAAVWVYDLSGATSMRKLTFGGANKFPLWSRDGQRVVFLSEKEGDTSLFWQRADGSGSAELLTKLEQKQSTEYSPESWSMDGKTLIFSSLGGDTSIWSVATERDAKPKVLIDVPSRRDQDANISPDGRWMVYDSGGGTGQPEIYVQPFPATGAKYQITTTLGIFPIWSPDGKQIFFLQNTAGVARIFSVDVQTQPSFVFGKPAPLPIEGILSNGRQGAPRGYDITPDGKQFLVMLPPSETEAAGIRQAQQINVTLNWFEELKQRSAAK